MLPHILIHGSLNTFTIVIWD